MELRSFIGKTVTEPATKQRYRLSEITSPTISAVRLGGTYDGFTFVFRTINGDPFSNGVLAFEETGLTKLFIEAYEAYSRTQDAFWEEYGYWMRRD